MSTVAFVDDGGHTGAPFSVPTAIILGLLASFIQSLGLTIQRKSHLLNESLSPARRVTEWRRPLWLVGFAIFLIANVGGTVFQIGALPIVMLAPLGAVSLLYNAVLARFLLNDLLSKYMVMGTLLIASGAVLIGYFGVVPSPPHSLDELLDLFARPTFVAFATIFTFVFVGVLTVSHLAEWQLHSRAHRGSPTARPVKKRTGSTFRGRLRRRWSAPTLAPVAEVSESSSGIATPVLAIRDEANRHGVSSTQNGIPDRNLVPPTGPASKRDYGTLGPSSRKRKKPDVPRLDLASLEPRVDAETLRSTKLGLAVAYGGASGTLSGACLLLAKSGVELLMLTFAGENQFGRYQSWLLLGILLAAALLQLWYLNKALKLADPTLVCPLAFCFYNTSSIALGLVYFDQVGELAWYDVVLVALGTAVLLGGVWTVSLHSSDDSDSLEERQPLLSSSPSVEEGMLANGAGVAGPHLPPVSISPSTFDIPPLASPEELLPTLPSEGGTTPKRRNSTRRPSIRLDFPDLFSPTRTPDLERNTSPDQSAVEEVGRRKPSLSALLEHGLSIGISPSSPGFHLQPRSPSLTRATGRRAPGRSMSEADAGAANEATQRVVGVGGNAERVEGEEATSGFAVMLDQIDLRRRLEAVGLGKQGGWWRRWFGRGGHPIAEEEEGFIVTSDSRGSLMAAPRPQGLGIHSAPGTSRDGRI
ncbi:Magnesium transporter NIPA [Kalmanozyma brasiliensis GHG001]|uniref:Magnesium transporter NIPA n=1 Tax=Kalmanozyma brasiliensis (strain GHG001) TaxID=1365824 RepID=UPI002867E8F4|nr:Magnesium transporter NIPA [Kalmanozyma brasiliensis GHG001]EST05315.2 Magnesium transporter NIPA [Kalmanozyma brasiliensis GHG001]